MILLRQNRKRILSMAFVMLVLIASALMLKPSTVPAQNAAANNQITPLPTVQSMEHLRKLLSENRPMYRYTAKGMAVNEAMPADPMAPQEATMSADFSSTNVQVEGVDEADLVKTDGSFIYQINNGTLTITRAIPANQMQLMSRTSFTDANFNPIDFYVTDNKLVLIGSGWNEPRPVPQPIQPTLEKRMVPPYYSGEATTRAIIYDISDKSKLVKVRELELKGNYLTSRRIGQTLYLISNDYLHYYGAQDAVPLPAFRDSAAGTQFNTIPYEKISYFPRCNYSSYIVTAAVDIDQVTQKAQVDTYLGTADNVYASTNNLYIAIPAALPRGPVIMDSAIAKQSEMSTNIFRFSLKDKQIRYSASGAVPGRILNQFSMDEYSSFFRIATTSDKYTGDTSTTSNNIYVLDEALQMKGKIENIAPGELIYSARFMSNRVYLVTFRTVDPFFVIDLTDPAQPKILGKLKIPGYSNYLHPYDENHIIGFGKDTVETKGYQGVPQAYYLGMKIALFDVSDLNNPVEMDKVIIGDRGTDSELLNNHKALLFAKDKNLLAFPVTVNQVDPSTVNQAPGSSPAYGSFAFQGAYVYNISLTGGLKYKGRITHLSQEDYLKAGDYWSEPDSSIQRILYIGNNLYTVSAKTIQAHQIDDLKLVGELKL